MKLGQTTVVYLGAKISSSVLSFLAIIYFTRTLGEETYGYYVIVLAVTSWLGIITSLGISKAVIKRMSEADENTDAYFIAGVIIKSLLIFIVTILVFIFQSTINTYVGRPVSKLIILLMVVGLMSTLVDTALQGTHQVHLFGIMGTFKYAGRYSIMIFLVFLGWELTGMLFGYAIGTAIVSIFGLWFVSPAIVLPKYEHFIRVFDFAKYSWLGKLESRTFKDMDILVLGLFVPAGLTGIYAVAYGLSKFLDSFGNAISITLFPEMSNLSSKDNYETVARLTQSSLSFGGLFLIPGIIGGVILGDRLMRIYGPGFERGTEVLVILLVGIAIYTYNTQILNTLNAIGRPDLTFRVNLLFVISNISLNFILVWYMGWIGAAIATTLSASIGLVIALYYLRTIIKIQIPYKEIGYEWISAVVMGLIIYLIRQISEGHYIASKNEIFVTILIGLGAMIYFIMLFAISSRFRGIINQNIPIDFNFKI